MQTSGSDDGNGQSGDTPKTFGAAMVVLQELDLITEGNIVSAYRDCLLVTVNGEVHLIKLPAFMAQEDTVYDPWEKKPEKFKKIHPNY